MEKLGIHDYSRYAELLSTDEVEKERLDSLLRVTITRFFRNISTWQRLEHLLIKLAPLRLDCWSAGCAGGEESFSLAMILGGLKDVGMLPGGFTVTATDTDASSLQRCQHADYARGSVREVPVEVLDRYFEEAEGRWSLHADIRKQVRFATHNLVTEEPPGTFGLVLLRNSVLTYNSADIQEQVLSRINLCLVDPGLLVIGRTESLPEGHGFERLGSGIYRKCAD
jgi:two-component system CheB/CheR fusion protein